MPHVYQQIKSKEMILVLKIVGGIVGLAMMLFFFWFIRTVIVASLFDTEKCKDCPMKNECFNALSFGFPTLCNNSKPLYTSDHV